VYYVFWVIEENNQQLKSNQWIIIALKFIYKFSMSHLVLVASGKRYGTLNMLFILYLSHLLSTQKTRYAYCILHVYPLERHANHIMFFISHPLTRHVANIGSFTFIYWKGTPFLLCFSYLLSTGNVCHSYCRFHIWCTLKGMLFKLCLSHPMERHATSCDLFTWIVLLICQGG
jgi:hypothetical protein